MQYTIMTKCPVGFGVDCGARKREQRGLEAGRLNVEAPPAFVDNLLWSGYMADPERVRALAR
jgi:hypothetical protein